VRSVRIRMVAAAIILAASGCTAASPAADAHKAFTLDKTCVVGVGCTIVASDIDAIPVGTLIKYTPIGDGSTFQKNATFTTANGSASGFCDFNHDKKPLAAQCWFPSGTGALKGFHLEADVTITSGDGKTPDSVWHWSGTYWFGD
jgi:hypothetical protein